MLADLDNDGRMDVVVCHVNEAAAVLHNVAVAGNRWVGVELAGENGGDVVGARGGGRVERPGADPVRQGRRQLRLLPGPSASLRARARPPGG